MKFTMIGNLTQCLLLAYRAPATALAPLLPRGLTLLTHRGHAFINIVACTVDSMRPRGVPRALGWTYHHVAYRLYVQSQTSPGQTISGLYFLHSDADSHSICLVGNRLTDFQFAYAPIDLHEQLHEWRISVGGQFPAELTARTDDSNFNLSDESCFDSPTEAAAFLKYQPHGLSVHHNILRIASVHRNESAWREAPLIVDSARWHFFNSLPCPLPILERATAVAPIDYRWEIGNKMRIQV